MADRLHMETTKIEAFKTAGEIMGVLAATPFGAQAVASAERIEF